MALNNDLILRSRPKDGVSKGEVVLAAGLSFDGLRMRPAT